MHNWPVFPDLPKIGFFVNYQEWWMSNNIKYIIFLFYSEQGNGTGYING